MDTWSRHPARTGLLVQNVVPGPSCAALGAGTTVLWGQPRAAGRERSMAARVQSGAAVLLHVPEQRLGPGAAAPSCCPLGMSPTRPTPCSRAPDSQEADEQMPPQLKPLPGSVPGSQSGWGGLGAGNGEKGNCRGGRTAEPRCGGKDTRCPRGAREQGGCWSPSAPSPAR